jgi:transposase
MTRGDLTDTQWQRIAPLLPKRISRRGRPSRDHRPMLNAMLWVLRTGAPWRDLPEGYGPWQTVYSRFRLWQRSGVLERLLARLQQAADAAGRLDWHVHHVDGTIVRAHQHAAGGKKGTPAPKP